MGLCSCRSVAAIGNFIRDQMKDPINPMTDLDASDDFDVRRNRDFSFCCVTKSFHNFLRVAEAQAARGRHVRQR